MFGELICHDMLTPRRLEIMRLMRSGTTTPSAISAALGIGYGTATGHLGAIYDILCTYRRNPIVALRFAAEHGLVQPIAYRYGDEPMLTDQEEQALTLLAEGKSDDEVADELGVSKHALARCLSDACEKWRRGNERIADLAETMLLRGLQ